MQGRLLTLSSLDLAPSGAFFFDYTLDILKSLISKLAPGEREALFAELELLESAKRREDSQAHFLPFVKALWQDFVFGHHHKIMADAFDAVLAGKEKRVVIAMPPRHTKSMFSSVYLPAWFLGKYPNKKIIQTSHTAELAVGFGRQVRNIIDSAEYQKLFPGVALAPDAKAAGRWNTNKGGEYFAIGAGGAVSGKGADLLVLDDVHSEQDAILAQTDPTVFDRVVQWYESGPRQRLQPGGSIIITATRWGLRDLTGQLIKKQGSDPRSDAWTVIELPAILPSGKPLWPEYWSLDELLATKASIPVSKWQAQYQQLPTSEEGALVKREWWLDWAGDDPKCEAVIQSWDTALSSKTSADYSVCTTWGVFEHKFGGRMVPRLILLDMIRGKWIFPDLKREFLYNYNKWKPGICIVEARASGQPLIYEMRSMGIPVQDVVVGRGTKANPNDKISRMNSISDIFSSGMVYVNKNNKWAEETIEEVASFPHGENDDIVDSVIHAIMRFRQGGWIGTSLDEVDEDDPPRRRRAAYY